MPLFSRPRGTPATSLPVLRDATRPSDCTIGSRQHIKPIGAYIQDVVPMQTIDLSSDYQTCYILFYLQTFLPSAANLTSLVTISDSYGAVTTSSQHNISVSALSPASIQALLLSTAAQLQRISVVSETAFWSALLITTEIAQLPSADQDPPITGTSIIRSPH
jgi:hypothetical protein